MMKTLVIHYSKFGNTQKVAEVMASALGSNGSVRVLSQNDLVSEDLKDADLVIMGSPTHRMNLPEEVRIKLDAFPKRILRGKKIAAFDTSYKMSRWLTPLTAAKKLSRKLKKLGGKQVVPPETFHVTASQGPLYDGEIERAQEWAKSVWEKSGA